MDQCGLRYLLKFYGYILVPSILTTMIYSSIHNHENLRLLQSKSFGHSVLTEWGICSFLHVPKPVIYLVYNNILAIVLPLLVLVIVSPVADLPDKM